MSHLWCMWSTNPATIIDICLWFNPKAMQATIISLLLWLQDLINLVMMEMICPGLLKNIEEFRMWPKQCLDEVITNHAYWQPQGSFWIHHPNLNRPGGKLSYIIMITTLTLRWLAVHIGCWISSTGGVSKRAPTQRTPISLMWHPTYSVSYHMESENRPNLPFNALWSARGNQNPQPRRFAKLSY